MSTYIGFVAKDADSAYGIVFPDAPGCFSAADDLDSVFAMASEALSGWTQLMQEEGHSLPPCRELLALRADPALTQLWEDAVLVIAVPAPNEASENRAA